MTTTTAILRTFRVLPLALRALITLRLQRHLHPFRAMTIMLLSRINRSRNVNALTTMFQRRTSRCRVRSVNNVTLRRPRGPGPSPERRLTITILLRYLNRKQRKCTRASRTIIIITVCRANSRIRVHRLSVQVRVPISLSINRLLRVMRVLMNFISSIRGLLTRATLGRFILNGLTRIRVVTTLSRLNYLNGFQENCLERLSTMLRPIIILRRRLRDVRILKVVEVVMISMRNEFLIRSFSRRSFAIRVNGTG